MLAWRKGIMFALSFNRYLLGTVLVAGKTAVAGPASSLPSHRFPSGIQLSLYHCLVYNPGQSYLCYTY